MGRRVSMETEFKYQELAEKAIQLLSGDRLFATKEELRMELGLTPKEIVFLFKRHHEVEKLWDEREKPEKTPREARIEGRYAELYSKASAAIASGNIYRNRQQLALAIEATAYETQDLFRRYPELVELWDKRVKIRWKPEYRTKTTTESDLIPEKKRRRRRCLTPLERDVREARKAGLSYGKWRAQKEEEKKNGWRT